ncbi:MAG: hypothetical protein JNK73_06065 [Bacteroidia bacterium]|nr:hypothetical protein [Bacteroidia bacterium]
MVSNHRREADHHPPLFFMVALLVLVFLFLKPGVLYGQKIKKYYVSSMQQKGTLYFIRPQKGFKNKTYGSTFIYDITCHSSSDSLTLNFSYVDKNIRMLDSLQLLGGSIKLTTPLSKIFVETQKSSWHYRFTTRFALKDVEGYFNENEMGSMALVEKNKAIPLVTSKKNWKKYASINAKIFQLIRYNK